MDTARDDTVRIAWAWRELRRGAAAAALRRHLDIADGNVLELGQVDALEVIAGRPDGINMTDFADAMHIDRSTATRAVDRLERLGFAERSVGERDSRVKVIRPTERGRAVIGEIVERRLDSYTRLLDTFDDDERAQLADQMVRMVQSLSALVSQLDAD